MHFSPFYLPWSDGTRCHDLCFLMLNFKPAFSVPSSILIKRLFSSSSLSAIRLVLFAYPRLLIFLLAVLFPACHLSSPAFHMVYSAYKLRKRLLRVPWTAWRSNQSILKEINPEYYSLKRLMLKLKLQYFGHLMQRADSLRPWCCERLKAGEAGDRGWDGWMASLIQWTQVWTNSRGQWKTGKPGVLQSMRLQRVRHDLATEQQEQIIKWHLFQGWKDFFNTPH